MVTTVANIRAYPEGPNTTYIGRGGKGRDGYFGNPFRMTNETYRTFAIDRYFAYFIDRITTDSEFALRVEELRGQVLLCFCAPKSCHGDIIASYLNDQEQDSPELYP